MQAPSPSIAAPGIALALLLIATSAFAQGPLTPPPGQPGPTMKSLDQVEARIPISVLPFVIITPGSYYLTTNLSVSAGNAISINADEVTIDLNGYSLHSSASPAAGNGILILGFHHNITIRNGSIRGQVVFSGGTFSGPGFLNGISYTGADPYNVLVADLKVAGCMGDAINLGIDQSNALRHSLVESVGGTGITAATVDSSVARNCGGTGIVAETASNSLGRSRGTDPTDAGLTAKSAQNCEGVSNSGPGLVAGNAFNCRGEANGAGFGLTATNALNSRGESVSGTGLNATSTSNCSGFSSSGIGLGAITATNSNGISTTGSAGMNVGGTASYCRGQRNGGTALTANIAIGCTSGGGTITAPGGKFLGTP